MNRVTVVIPTYNGSRFLGQTIESLLEQTYPHLALICLDDASTDGSAEIAAAVGGGRVRIVRNEQRIGLAANWNRARELCQSEYLVIAHQDDLYEKTFAASLALMLDTHGNAFAAHAKAMTIDADGRRTNDPAGRYKDRFWFGAEPQERSPLEDLEILRTGNYVIAPAVMFRTAAMDAIGPFDDRYQFVTDWDYWLRGLFAGYTLVGTHARLVRFRRHDATSTRDSERTMRRYEEELGLLKTINGRLQSPPSFAAIENTLIDDCARRLLTGDHSGARRLRDFGRERIPRFSGSIRDRMMSTAIHAGWFGGALLRAAIQSGVIGSLLLHSIRAKRDQASKRL
jgi:glycosyltransferase involved in cell wall biosynthesis